MKKLSLIFAAIVLAISAQAQTMNVVVGNVTYQFPSSQAGLMEYYGGNTLVIMGKTFDDGTFGSLSNNLNNMVKTFEEVANECSVKMNSIDAEIEALKNQMEIM